MTIAVATKLGKSWGNVENVDVINMEVPTPSVIRSERQATINIQVEGILSTNLYIYSV